MYLSLCKTEVLCHDSYFSSKYAQTSWDYLNFCIIFNFLFLLLCFPKILLLHFWMFFFFMNTMKICDLILKITFKLKKMSHFFLSCFVFFIYSHRVVCAICESEFSCFSQTESISTPQKRNNTQIKMIYNHACSNNCSTELIQILIHALMNQQITDYIQYYIRTFSHSKIYINWNEYGVLHKSVIRPCDLWSYVEYAIN